MRKYICSQCLFIYNPFLENESESDIYGFSDLPEYWECPQCGVQKEYFTEYNEPTQDMFDEENQTHRASLIRDPNDVCKIYLTIGSDDGYHDQTDIHYIDTIWIEDEDGVVLFSEVYPDISKTYTCIYNGQEELSVYIRCSVHGVWKGIFYL